MMKKALVALLALAMLPGVRAAEDVTVVPDSIYLNLSLSQNATVEISVKTNSTIYDEITIHSDYLLEYIPHGAHVEPNDTKQFTLKLGGIDDYERRPDEANITHKILESEIVINGTDISTIKTLFTIPLTINLSLPEVEPREYIFKKCFIENNQEFCTEFNITGIIVNNITIVNETVENVSYNILMPYNTTRDFMERYAEILNDAANDMNSSREGIVMALAEMVRLQDERNNRFQNSIILEGYLKNPDVPLYTEIAPDNKIKNMTGLSDQEFLDAMNVLFSENKITQKTELEVQTFPLPTGNGFTTRQVEKIFIASIERVNGESQRASAGAMVFYSLLIAALSVAFIVLYKTLWVKRTGKL